LKNVLFITSFYSGLRKSVLENNWLPEGMPAIYKLLERLYQKEISFDYVFMTDSSFNGIKMLHLDQFKDSNFLIIPRIRINTLKGFIKDYLINSNLFNAITSHLNLNDYVLIYIDRANVGLIPFINRLFKGRVMLRLHGVGELLTRFDNRMSYIHYGFKRYAFSRIIDTVICTEDGTPGQIFINKYIKNAKKSYVLLNGIDDSPKIEIRYNNEKLKQLNLLFIGRLDVDKGILEIIEFIKIAGDLGTRIKINIVGSGSYEDKVKLLADKYPFVEFQGTLPHSNIINLYLESDIYISLNKLGNLSNTTLEAINYGLGIITLAPDLRKKKDITTALFLGSSAEYIDRDNIPLSLKSVIKKIIDMKGQRKLNFNTLEELKPKLNSWVERLDFEIDLIIKNS